ncbi:asparagine synthase [Sulfurihydrogenibium azorense Az-Fu1]|uniref:asparagine synthase (glutamine-hydrolyzing) n=1 Tax=Sulfurihydrogenibium azorense (strain DSM 15241 / OCM 825 / Az-Fu1) TaxID=204536 RepID=C1DTA6_SULAA|nr:asparagine synthase (glutamine-hydrolyzing) [Sulfurihydrogenibium azorense]ACN98141.1 asparagine synthase [Sulfurihydrogenibium azorense Az-Fu1]
MCGIVGLVCNENINSTLIRDMANTIKHRGPDDEGFIFLSEESIVLAGGDDTSDKVWNSNFLYSPKSHINSLEGKKFKVALGHRRLSILDLSPAGHQPMCDEAQKVWIVFNGEIYNYLELREELKQKGYTFITNTDTEVLLKSYIEWGFDCVSKFNGMWAFAILDLRKNILFLSRDRFGVKPLYYYKDDNYFAFASEIKALLRLPFIKKEVNYEAVFDYIALGLEEQGEESFFKGIRELKPSYNIVLNLNNFEFKLHKYYELLYYDKFEKYNPEKEKKYISEIRELIFEAIRLRLRSDASVGSCLSGGLDSSTIVCVMNEIIKNQHLSQVGDYIKCFTASYKDDKVDESNWAKIVVESTKSQWIRTFPTEKELIEDLEDLIYTQDIPFGSTSIYAQYRVMKAAYESGVKVLLDGQGGDELFTGYTGYFPTYYRELIKNFDFTDLINEIKNVNNSPIDIKSIIKMAIKSELGKFLTFPKIRDFLIKRISYPISLLNPEFYKEFSYRIKDRQEKIPNSLNQQLHQLITGFSLKRLLRYEDRNSMRFSIESRTPFADDINLIEYCFEIPSVYKIHNGFSKYVLRQAMDGVLPEQIRKRVDKVGFATPEEKWLRINKGFVEDIMFESHILKDIANIQKLKNDCISFNTQ